MDCSMFAAVHDYTLTVVYHLVSTACKLGPQMAACDLMMKRVAGMWPETPQTAKETEL